ncbi:MAG TPA: adenylate/guanylate cyclase domain-containing protein, partial [Cyanophyceae cyanobacterium]
LDSEAELQALFAAMTDIVIVLNAQGRYLKIAPTNPALLYKPANELIGKTLHEVFPPEQADIFMGYLQQALYSRQTINVEYSRRTFMGQEIWLAASISPLSDDSVIWVASDITERRKAEEILRNIALGVSAATGEAFFHLLVQYLAKTLDVEYAFVGELVRSEPQRIRTVAVCAYGQMLENFDYYLENTACQQVLQQGLSVYPCNIQQQFPLDLLLQEMRVESYLGIPLLDSTGRALGVLTVLGCKPFPDTKLMEKIVQIFAVRAAAELERRQAEVALRRAEERYRSIFENTDKGLFQLAPDGRYLSANPALALIFGYSSPEELIQSLSNVNQQLYVDPKYRAKCLILLREHGSLPNFQFQAYRKDGGMIWILENAHVVRGDRGELLYYEGSVIDITERKIWEEALRYHQECTEELLLNILPEPIAERLKMAESTIADSFAEVTVLFADLVNFTEISAQILPTELVELLNKIFSHFDQLAEEHNLEKIKTIGDAYMVVGGLPHPRFDHVEAVADMALDMQQEISHFKRHDGTPFYLRIGIHTGPVVAGVIGMKKFSYDLWGDTVNVANRMESQGLPGGIQVTEAVYEYLKDKYYLERRGAIAVKGKGEMITYWLTGKKPSQL